jgi:hypothetical protein
MEYWTKLLEECNKLDEHNDKIKLDIFKGNNVKLIEISYFYVGGGFGIEEYNSPYDDDKMKVDLEYANEMIDFNKKKVKRCYKIDRKKMISQTNYSTVNELTVNITDENNYLVPLKKIVII